MMLPQGATYTSTSGVFLTAPPGNEIRIDVSEGEVVTVYGGTFESSPTLASGSWERVPGAASPYQIPTPASGLRFYRSPIP